MYIQFVFFTLLTGNPKLNIQHYGNTCCKWLPVFLTFVHYLISVLVFKIFIIFNYAYVFVSKCR